MTDLTRRNMLKVTGAALAGLTINVGKAHSEENRKKVRLAVVGGGFGITFQWHLHPNCEVVAVTDLRADRRRRLKYFYKCDNVYDSLEEMIEKEQNIDAVAVFSEATNHVKHAKMCFENGWHVLSAVPACTSIEEAEMLKEVAERTGLTYMMAETSYYKQETILARDLYNKGILGEVFYTELDYYHDRGDMNRLLKDKKTRFWKPDGSHSWRWGYPPLCYPTHCLGYLVGITGERITRVSGLGWGDDHPMVTDNVYGNPFWNQASLMQTDRGHMAKCNIFLKVAAHDERALFYGDKASFYMTDSRSPAKLDFRTKGDTVSYLDAPKQKSNHIKAPLYWKTDMLPKEMRVDSGHGGSHVFLSAEFINAIVEERTPAVDLYDALAMTVPGIMGHQSSLKNGEQLEVPQFENPEKLKLKLMSKKSA